MAIHPDFPGLEAEVVVNERPLKEYDDEEIQRSRNPTTSTSVAVSKYVEVDSDVCFGIRYTIPRSLTGKCGVQSGLMIDGHHMRSSSHSASSIERGDVSQVLDSVTRNADGFSYMHKFCFSRLKTDEDGPDIDEVAMRQIRKIGCITLRFSFVESVTTREPTRNFPERRRAQREEALSAIGTVAEKSLKGDVKSHQAGLHAPELLGAYVPSHTGTRKNTSKPFATFIFKYRSLAALKALHIIPRTPSLRPASPTPLERNIDDMSREELLALVRSRNESVDATLKVKQEASLGVKREADDEKEVQAGEEVEFVSRKRVKTLPTSKDEVIELN